MTIKVGATGLPGHKNVMEESVLEAVLKQTAQRGLVDEVLEETEKRPLEMTALAALEAAGMELKPGYVIRVNGALAAPDSVIEPGAFVKLVPERLEGGMLAIPAHLWHRLHVYANTASPLEVSGLGLVREDAEGDFEVTELFPLLPEVRSGADVSVGSAQLDTLPEVPEGHTLLWWHSHGSGAVYFSATDHKSAKMLSAYHQVVCLVINMWQDADAMLQQPDGKRVILGVWVSWPANEEWAEEVRRTDL
jgi:hypothetical protein